MQISLKQREIEAALRAYVMAQGISLTNKTIDISFTATRTGGAGIVAEIDIEEVVAALPTGAVIRDFQAVPVNAAPTATERVLTEPAAAMEPEPAEANVDGHPVAPEPEVAVEPSKSLFG